MTTRGRIKLLVFCLLSGAVINIAVAWGCACWRHGSGTSFEMSNDQASALWAQFAPSEWKSQRGESRVLRAFGHQIESLYVKPMRFGDNEFEDGLIDFSCGWPLLSVHACGVFNVKAHNSPILRYGLRLSGSLPGFYLQKGQWLPYGPIWPGLIINTLFYAATVWLIVRLPSETRRRLRQWRGRCEKCAYPIGESPVCTECGAAIKRRAKLHGAI